MRQVCLARRVAGGILGREKVVSSSYLTHFPETAYGGPGGDDHLIPDHETSETLIMNPVLLSNTYVAFGEPFRFVSWLESLGQVRSLRPKYATAAVSTFCSSVLAALTVPKPMIDVTFGIAMPARTPKMATTMRSSMRVNPRSPDEERSFLSIIADGPPCQLTIHSQMMLVEPEACGNDEFVLLDGTAGLEKLPI